MDKTLEIRKEIFANGKIDTRDILILKEYLFENGGMTIEKGNFLFNLKDTISIDNLSYEFKDLFIEAILELLLNDENSPGEIDENEGKWLRAKIQSKGYWDKLDIQLLEQLKKKSINFPEILHYKGRVARCFENSLYLSRFIIILAVIASIVSSIALFIKGTLIAIETIDCLFDDLHEYESLLVGFISSVDIYLFAMVLIIFGMGIYELFIGKMDPIEKKTDTRPSWLQVSSIDDLKSSLGRVILMVLIVNFFKYTLNVNFDNAKDLLFLAIGVVLVSMALYIANKSHGYASHKK